MKNTNETKYNTQEIIKKNKWTHERKPKDR